LVEKKKELFIFVGGKLKYAHVLFLEEVRVNFFSKVPIKESYTSKCSSTYHYYQIFSYQFGIVRMIIIFLHKNNTLLKILNKKLGINHHPRR
jgi:hypothetical protein